LYLALPSIGALLGGPYIFLLRELESKESSTIGDSSKDSAGGLQSSGTLVEEDI